MPILLDSQSLLHSHPKGSSSYTGDTPNDGAKSTGQVRNKRGQRYNRPSVRGSSSSSDGNRRVQIDSAVRAVFNLCSLEEVNDRYEATDDLTDNDGSCDSATERPSERSSLYMFGQGRPPPAQVGNCTSFATSTVADQAADHTVVTTCHWADFAAALFSPCKHGLRPVVEKAGDESLCDKCDQRIQEGHQAYSCDICDFDLCATCYSTVQVMKEATVQRSLCNRATMPLGSFYSGTFQYPPGSDTDDDESIDGEVDILVDLIAQTWSALDETDAIQVWRKGPFILIDLIEAPIGLTAFD